MSTINRKLEPFVITEHENHFSTLEEMEQHRDSLEKISEELNDEDYAVLPAQYTYTSRPFVFPILKTMVVPFHRGEDDTPVIPSYLLDNEKLLEQAYNAVVLEGKVYSKDHPDVVKTADTKRYVFKKDAFNVIGGRYCERKDNLVELPQYGGYAYKKDVTVTADTKRQELKSNCHAYTDKGGKTSYYKYPQLMPDAPRERIFFTESKHMEPDEFNETRIGIELEYSTAVTATRRALLNDHFRDRWDSIRDGTIPDGAEFVSVPLKYEELNEIEKFMKFNKKNKAAFNNNCGFHVHIGSPKLDFIALTSVIRLCENIQDDIFKLVPDDRKNNRFCRPLDDSFRGFKNVASNKDEKRVADIFYADVGTSYERRHQQSKWSVHNKRHYWVSVDRFFRFRKEPYKRTVEFRLHPATHNTEEFMQFILLCYYIVEFGIQNNPEIARNATLKDLLRWIPNTDDQRKVKDLFESKKVLEYVK